MKIFITGANGFIGSNLCRHFLSQSWEVYGLVRRTSDLHFLNGLDVKLVTGDLLRPEEVRIPDGIDHIVHAASIVSDWADDETCRKHIYQLAVNLVQKIQSLPRMPKRIVYISTAVTLGFNALDISEERPGRSALFLDYTRYKVKTEQMFLDEWRRSGLPVVILRPADVYGPYDRTSCAKILRACEHGVGLIAGHGNRRFGFCYIDNLCQVVHLALFKEGIEGRAYTVTNGELPTWRTFFSGLQKGLNKKQRFYQPIWIVFAIAACMEAVHKLFPRYEASLNFYRIKRITTETTYDISRTISELGYAPDDRIDRQIEAIVAWYLKERRDGFIK